MGQSTPVITFSEYPRNTWVTNHYVDRGVEFISNCFITEDGAQPTSPVLSGSPLFFGDITWRFVAPGTHSQATCNHWEADIGYINNPGEVEVRITGPSGNHLVTLPTFELGINHFVVKRPNMGYVRVSAAQGEVAGFSMDNLHVLDIGGSAGIPRRQLHRSDGLLGARRQIQSVHPSRQVQKVW